MLKHRIIFNDASNWSFDLAKALGVYIWTSNRKKLLDFTSGWNVTNLGWNNPEISDAIVKQAKINTYSPMEVADEIQKDLAKLLTDALPKEFRAVGRTTGGMESNEEAIKTAKAYTNRKKIVGFRHGYHGQSISMLSIVLEKEFMEEKGLVPVFPAVEQMEYPTKHISNLTENDLLKDFEIRLENLLEKKDVAAVLTEAGIITGWGSTYTAPRGFLKTLRDLTKKYDTLLILDEVGTGFSRCGKLFGMEIEGIVPDIATFAKGFSNGAAAIGAMVTTEEIAERTWKKTNLQSTFGWIPISCAAAKKNLEIHLRDKVWIKSASDGNYMHDVLSKELLKLDFIGDIRGYGMELGVNFIDNKLNKNPNVELAQKVVKEAFNKGLYILYGDDGNIQLMPPLIINRRDLDIGLDILISSIKRFN